MKRKMIREREGEREGIGGPQKTARQGFAGLLPKSWTARYTSEEIAWILYDVGNSAFTMIAASLIPIWFKALAITGQPGGLSSDQATAAWALGVSIVTVLVALLGPFFGAIADHQGYKKLIFTTALAVGVITCILCGFVNSWLAFFLFFIVARIAYSASLTFYDSMLVDVTSEERMDVISSFGFAWGYIGSCLPFLIALLAYVAGDMLHWIDPYPARIISCTVTALWWFVVTVPLLRFYRQKHFVAAAEHPVRSSFFRIRRTLQEIVRENPRVLYFLLAFFMYIDGVGTIIDNAINIGTDLGLDTVGQVIFLLATQFVAFAFSLFFARLSRKVRTVTLIEICIAGYFLICMYALTLHTLLQFGLMAFGVGLFQGSIQALSRSYYSRIIPKEHSGEYFGLYDIFAKGASFLGSLFIALVKYAGGSINIAVGSLALFFVLGFALLYKADHLPEQRPANT